MTKLRLLGAFALGLAVTAATASVSQAGTTPLNATVSPALLNDGGVSLVFEYAGFSTNTGQPRAILKKDYGRAQLRIDDLSQPALIVCTIKASKAEPLAVAEYLDGGAGYGETGQVLTFDAGTDSIEFIAEPSPVGDYMYALSTPSASWYLLGCTAETL